MFRRDRAAPATDERRCRRLIVCTCQKAPYHAGHSQMPFRVITRRARFLLTFLN
jgi:hypothetical protein